MVVPVWKPVKHPTLPGSYRQIALTSHMYKVMESMATDRLRYFLESRGLLSHYQSRFRKGRGTIGFSAWSLR